MIGAILRALAGVYLSLVLGAAGAAKLSSPAAPVGGLLTVFPLSFGTAVRLGRFLAWVELTLGLLALGSIGLPLLAAPVVTFFLLAAAYSVALSRRAPGVPCGCFGAGVPPTADHSQAIVSVIFAAAGFAVAVSARGETAATVPVAIACATYCVLTGVLVLRRHRLRVHAYSWAA